LPQDFASGEKRSGHKSTRGEITRAGSNRAELWLAPLAGWLNSAREHSEVERRRRPMRGRAAPQPQGELRAPAGGSRACRVHREHPARKPIDTGRCTHSGPPVAAAPQAASTQLLDRPL